MHDGYTGVGEDAANSDFIAQLGHGFSIEDDGLVLPRDELREDANWL